jgi:hypothetical protein
MSFKSEKQRKKVMSMYRFNPSGRITQASSSKEARENKGYADKQYEKNVYDKYDVKDIKLKGYTVETLKIGDNYTMYVPNGDNKNDKKLFDKLVYENKTLLYAKTREQLIKQVKDFIKENEE